MGRLQLNVLATFAQFEREIIAERTREGRAAKRARGLRIAGPAPFGYAVDRRTKRLIVHRADATTVRSMFMLAQEGRTPGGACGGRQRLGHDGLAGPRRAVERQTGAAPPAQPGLRGGLPDGSRGTHTPVVGQEMFARVNAAIGSRRTREPSERRPSGVDPFLLRGLLACPRCGRRLTTSSSGKVTRRGLRYYRCRGLRACPGVQLPAEAIESFVASTLAQPPAGLSADARAACRGLARIWELFTPDNRKRALAHLFRTIRADVDNGEIEFVVDEVQAAEWARDLAPAS
jgi:site-specific DNA recombinase